MPDPESRLPPTGEIVPPAPGTVGKIKCEFCQCQLTPTGDVFRMSDEARTFNKHTETITKKSDEIAALETTIRELRAKVTELSAGREKSDFDLTF